MSDAHKLVGGLTFAVGHTFQTPRMPISLHLIQKGTGTIDTRWPLEDAEAMAYALLKHVELVRRTHAETKLLRPQAKANT